MNINILPVAAEASADNNFASAHMRKCKNRTFLHMTAECFARLAIVEVSVHLSACPYNTLRYCVKTRQDRITKSSLWAATRTLVFSDKILCP